MNAHPSTRRMAVAGFLASLALAGCSSTQDKGASAGSDDGAKRFKTAQQKLQKTSGYHVKLTGADVPEDGSVFKAGEGDVVNKPASFGGKVTVKTGGNQIDADVIAIDKQTWVKQGTAMKNYMPFDTASVGVPSPAALFSATNGIPALPAKASHVSKTGEKLVDGQQVTMFKGTVDGATAVKAMSFGRPRSDYTVEFGLTGADELRVLTVTGPFFDTGNATYTLNFSNYGQNKKITKP